MSILNIDNLPAISRQIWVEKYALTPTETIRDGFARVAAALFPDRDTDHDDLLTAMLNLEFLPAGRTLAGAGSGRAVTLVNCFVMGTIPDSLDGIFEHLREAALTLKQGGGIGYDFSTIRPRGAPVRGVAAEASGPLSFMDTWDAMCQTVMSAGIRRGAMMATLRCDHPDIGEFIDAKRTPGRLRNFNLSVLVTDALVAAVQDDADWPLVFGGEVYRTVRAKDLWNQITRSTYDHAEPGVIFIDRVNALNNLAGVETIFSTNPCFTGDTAVWTAAGPRRFDDLARDGGPVEVLTQLDDGRLAYRTMTSPRLTRQGAELVEVSFLGSSKRRTVTTVRCTPDHEFYLTDGTHLSASNLLPGDRIVSAYRGMVNQKGYVGVRGQHESVLEHHLSAERVHGHRPTYPTEHVHHINEIKDDNRLENVVIVGAREHNAEKMRGQKNPMNRFPEKNRFREGFTGPENGMFGKKHSEETRARIGAKTRKRFEDPEFRERHRLSLTGQNHTVLNVNRLSVTADVYCGTVADTGRFFISLGSDWHEGVLVKNCGEQPLPPYGACCLGSINLVQLIGDHDGQQKFNLTRLKELTQIAVRTLDRVLDATGYPLPEQRAEAMLKRRIGIGITGYADACLALGHRYGGTDARGFLGEALRVMRNVAYETSAIMAEEYWPFPLFDLGAFRQTMTWPTLNNDARRAIERHGLRNSHLLSIAPTGTLSMLLGNVSSGIEPVFAWATDRRIRTGTGPGSRVERVADPVYTAWNRDHPDKPEPAHYVTMADLTVDDHLLTLAVAQSHVDSAVSKTINCPADIMLNEFQGVYTRAYEMGCKGCTTYRPNAITGAILTPVTEPAAEPAPEPGPVETYRGGKRPAMLPGRTYKIKPSTEEHGIYVVVNDDVGSVDPVEVFFISRDVTSFSWRTAVSRLITAILRRGLPGDLDLIERELGSVFDPRGGYWDGGRYYPSVLAQIARVLTDHTVANQVAASATREDRPPATGCPRCGGGPYVSRDGCRSCEGCGYSTCG